MSIWKKQNTGIQLPSFITKYIPIGLKSWIKHGNKKTTRKKTGSFFPPIISGEKALTNMQQNWNYGRHYLNLLNKKFKLTYQ